MAGDWIKIVGFSGYEVHASGLVRSVDRYVRGKHGPRFAKGRHLKQFAGTGGYLFVCLSNRSEMSHKRIHVLVAAHFIGARPERHDVDHINFDRTDNRVENLRYLHQTENRGQRR